MATQSAAFTKAVEDSRKLKAKPNQDELLELYAHYKQGFGENFAKTSAPSSFNFKEKYKYNAWKEVSEKGTSPEAAQKHYVELVERLKKSYGFEG
ncbi:hypothetical protein MMC21_005648 [Puttea exsequens]|nr:hypothetical protein [Puttea exsequens]